MVFLSSPPARLLVVPLYLSGEGKSIFHSDSPWTLPLEGFSGRPGGPGGSLPRAAGRAAGHGDTAPDHVPGSPATPVRHVQCTGSG